MSGQSTVEVTIVCYVSASAKPPVPLWAYSPPPQGSCSIERPATGSAARVVPCPVCGASLKVLVPSQSASVRRARKLQLGAGLTSAIAVLGAAVWLPLAFVYGAEHVNALFLGALALLFFGFTASALKSSLGDVVLLLHPKARIRIGMGHVVASRRRVTAPGPRAA
jgi:hypothetical protein